jgi:hypothetical protein
MIEEIQIPRDPRYRDGAEVIGILEVMFGFGDAPGREST